VDMKTVELKDIKSSPYNSRKTFDAEKMKELVASVVEKGILNPILLRTKGNKYEIVCGERRFRAATTAGLTEIPAVVRILTDQQALECMVIENLQREDVHPLEEAEGYEALMKKHGYKTVDDIAAKIGKSRGYVYGRLKLCELIPENRKLFYSGKFSPSVALLVAKVPPSLQLEAGKYIANGGDWGRGEPLNYRDAKGYIEEKLMVQIKEAQFDPKEKGLAGKCSCVECPRRTGNDQLLFADVQGKDICTDPGCFEAKKNATVQREMSRLKEKGKTVISPEEAKQLFRYRGDESPDKKYIALDEHDYSWPSGVTVRKMLKNNKDAKIIYAIQPFTGKVIEMVDRSDLPGILKSAGIKTSAGGSSRGKDLTKAKRDNRIRNAKYSLHVSKVSTIDNQRVRNVIILDRILEDLDRNARDMRPREILKGIVKGTGKSWGDCWTITQLYELGDQKVQELICRVILERSKALADDDLEFLCESLGFSMAKDYAITKEYLEACTKDELVKLIKELGMSFAQEASAPKKVLVEYVFKNAPKGKVPKELIK